MLCILLCVESAGYCIPLIDVQDLKYTTCEILHCKIFRTAHDHLYWRLVVLGINFNINMHISCKPMLFQGDLIWPWLPHPSLDNKPN